MATWEQLGPRLREAFAVERASDDELVVTVSAAGATGEPARSQRVVVRRYAAWGRPMLEIRSAFGERGDFDAASLLADNIDLPLGAVALHDDFLVLVHRAALDGASPDTLLWLVRQVGALADILESRSGVDRF